MHANGSNAVQLLLLVAGLTLIPAMLFTVTGFTRILVVLGFIRTGLGTPTAPPNQVQTAFNTRKRRSSSGVPPPGSAIRRSSR